MLSRQESAERVNEIVNDPSIYPWICGPLTEPLDLTTTIESGNYIALVGEYGGFLFWKIAPGLFDAHSAILPEGRGRWTIKAAKSALDWMFGKEGADEIMMVAPQGNLAVLSLVRVLKAKPRGSVADGWWRNGKPVAANVYSLTKSDYELCR